MKALFFDPGQITGYTLFEVPIRGSQIAPSIVDSGEIPFDRLAYKLPRLIRQAEDVAYEKVVALTASMRTEGIEVIGMIKIISAMEQIPSRAVSPSVLHGARKWKVNLLLPQGEHARDAALHGVASLRVQGFQI